MDVVVLRWPADAARRTRLLEDGVPHLLLLEHGSAAPGVEGCLDDWVRLPAPDAEIEARVAALVRRCTLHAIAAVRPVLDGGVLRCGARWVPLSPVEERLARVLVDRFGSVVTREVLTEAGWPGSAPRRNALDVHVLRLRRRLAPIALAIRTVRSRGYVLERAGDDGGG